MEKESTKKMEGIGNDAAQGLGRFSCLPEDVLMSILNRTHDLKCLFQFTLVSKDFALKTRRIKSISMKLPAIVSTETPINIFHLSSKMLSGELEKFSILHPPPSPRQELRCTKFLQTFTELECAFFEAPCPRTPCSSPSLKWKVKLGNCTPAVQMLVSVLPKTLHATESESESESESAEEVEEGNEENDDDDEEEEDDEDEVEEEDEDGEDTEDEEVFVTLDESLKYLAKGCLLSSLMNFAEWFDLIFSLIRHHDALKSVICTDSGKHGKIVLNDEQIVEWRKLLLCGKLSHESIPRNIIYGWVPSLSPGYKEERLSFVIMNFISSPVSGRDILRSFEYDQEEKIIADAVTGILTKAHSSCVNILRW